MKKLLIVLSLAVVLSFAVTACIKLIPQSSREGLEPQKTATPESTETSVPITPPKDGDTTVYPDFTLSGETYNETVSVNGITVGTISFYVPKVSYPDSPDIAEKINALLKTKSDDHINNYREECNFLAMDFDPEEMPPYRYNASSRLYVSENTVSIKIIAEIDYGSVFTEKSVFCYNFSVETGEEITLDDTDIDKTALADAAIEKSLTMTEYEFTTNYQNYIREHICNSWYIDKNVIYLVYVPLEITSGIHGTVEIPVDLGSLK